MRPTQSRQKPRPTTTVRNNQPKRLSPNNTSSHQTRGASGWARWAIGSFATSLVCAVIVLVPYRWVFESDPSTFRWYFENATAEELRSSLFEDAITHHRNNHSKLRWLGWVLTVQVIALGLTAVGVLSIFVGR
jgi:hypothetical protein